jgi:CDP-glycerol glycerophosphotransferase (TagB/SpsB family)
MNISKENNILTVSYKSSRQNITKKIDLDKEPRNKEKELFLDYLSDTNRVRTIYYATHKNNEIYIYSKNRRVIFAKKSKNILKENIFIDSKLLYIKKMGDKLYIGFFAYVISKLFTKKDIPEISFVFGDKEMCKIKIHHVYKNKLSFFQKIKKSFKLFHHVVIPIDSICDTELKINNNVCFKINIDNLIVLYHLISNKNYKKSRYVYLPTNIFNYKHYVCFFRRNSFYGLVFVKRIREDIEKTWAFKLYENKLVSLIFLLIAKIYRLFSKKNINLYYEKNASKAEEGVYELFEKISRNYNGSKNYFIITRDSKDYIKVKNNTNVVLKFSLKYYFLLYLSNNLITSEAPMHISVLRSINGVLRKSLIDKRYIFLQHGITYMKNTGRNGVYSRGREAECDFIIVSSKKEQEVVCETFDMDKCKVWNTGMPIFDIIKHDRITSKSPNIITVSLTWKDYEEHFESFENSTYCKNSLEIYKMLTKHIDSKYIKIVPHPKVKEQMLKILSNNGVHEGSISEAIANTKLLITDYSSICYNAFYQGAAVVFYQPDLKLYENKRGKLIPTPDEYIGYRVHSIDDLDVVMKAGIVRKQIKLDYFRTEKFIQNYSSINEFRDGNNADRIIDNLKKNCLI